MELFVLALIKNWTYSNEKHEENQPVDNVSQFKLVLLLELLRFVCSFGCDWFMLHKIVHLSKTEKNPYRSECEWRRIWQVQWSLWAIIYQWWPTWLHWCKCRKFTTNTRTQTLLHRRGQSRVTFWWNWD